ncbi:MAG: hypothetical protein KAS12_01595 [Candidatus Aenigmarchaeota archaeon]|nr:hypothetical protein [Candidatus Aenigmarchaeota archaeon]
MDRDQLYLDFFAEKKNNIKISMPSYESERSASMRDNLENPINIPFRNCGRSSQNCLRNSHSRRSNANRATFLVAMNSD